jgi:hypothetical protein
MIRRALQVPIEVLSILNGCLIVAGLSIDTFVFDAQGRYPFPVLLVGAGLMSYLPYYCVSRDETLFRADPGGRKSRTAFYGIAYFFFVVFLIIDADLVRRWVC